MSIISKHPTNESASDFATISDDELLRHAERLRDKVVVITGESIRAASGIGREAATRFAISGAKVVIGDIDVSGAESLVTEIRASGGQATSTKCNVTVWEDQVALFELAIRTYNAVDVVVANAGVGEIGDITKIELNAAGKPKQPTMATVQINLVGLLYTVHLAQYHLTLNHKPNAESLKSLILMGSMASWMGTAIFPVYTATKHGVLGLMRSLDPVLASKGIRVATITPFFADTAIIKDVLPPAYKIALAGIPFTPVSRIAGAILYAATNPDPEAGGRVYMLPDNGPVLKVPREEFKLGIYKMMDERANFFFKRPAGIAYVLAITKDVLGVVGKPVAWSALSIAVARGAWVYYHRSVRH